MDMPGRSGGEELYEELRRRHPEFAQRLEKRFSPAVSMALMLRASAVVMAYEHVRHKLEERLKGFYSDEPREDWEWPKSSSWRSDVLKLAPKPVPAMRQWYVTHQVLTMGDVRLVEAMCEERNRLAHEPGLLYDPDYRINTDLISRILPVGRKLEVHWALIAADCDPRFDGRDLGPDDVASPMTELLSRLLGMCELADRLESSAD
jgi:hypothetical protein